MQFNIHVQEHDKEYTVQTSLFTIVAWERKFKVKAQNLQGFHKMVKILDKRFQITYTNVPREEIEKVVKEMTVEVIVECNRYENGIRVEQCSRSPFVFSKELTDEEIIQSIKENEYKIY